MIFQRAETCPHLFRNFYGRENFTPYYERGRYAFLYIFLRKELDVMSLLSLAKTGITIAGKFAVQHAPVISACLATVGVISTGIAAYKAGKKASVLIKKAEAEKGSPLTTGEKIKTTGKTVIPVAIAAIITVAAIWTGQYASGRKLKQACAFYSAALAAKDVQIEKISSEVGEEIVKKVTSEKHEEDANKAFEALKESGSRAVDNSILVIDEDGIDCIDGFSGRVIKISQQRVTNAIVATQRDYVNTDAGLAAKAFYTHCGWPYSAIPDIATCVGWDITPERHMSGWVPKILVDSTIDEKTGKPMMYVDMQVDSWLFSDNGLPF